MPQLVEQNGALKWVDSLVYNFNEVKPGAIVSFEFPFKGTESDIEYIETNCPCVKAKYDRATKKIVGTLEVNKIQKNPFTVGQTSVGKTFNVILNDGVNRYTANGDKQRVTHPLKQWFQLQVTGLVVV